MKKISDRELGSLSAYLDGEVSHKDRERIEARINEDAEFAEFLEQLKNTRALIRNTPKLRAPRNYLLTPEMVGQASQPRRLFPVFRFASALATVVLILFLFGDFYLVQNVPLTRQAAMQEVEAVGEDTEPIIPEAEFFESQAPEEPLPEEIEEMPVEEAPLAPEPVLGAEQPAEREVEMEKILETNVPSLESALNDVVEGDSQMLEEPPLPTEAEATPRFVEEEEVRSFPIVEEVFPSVEEPQVISTYGAIFRIIEVALILVIISTGLVAFILYLRER
jgi:hypothetical protein